MLEGKGQGSDLKEFFPADSLDPFTNSLMLVGSRYIGIKDLPHRRGNLRPTGGIVLDKGTDPERILRIGMSVEPTIIAGK